MQNNQKNYFRIKPLTKYDYRPYVDPGKRESALKLAMDTHPKLDCRGKNPSKITKKKEERPKPTLTRTTTISSWPTEGQNWRYSSNQNSGPLG